MTEKRFVQKREDNNYEDFMVIDNQQNKILYNDEILNTMNKLHEENQQLIQLLKNQSVIIQELHSKLLEYQLKEPIILTREDLETMGGAISYYTHGRCGE